MTSMAGARQRRAALAKANHVRVSNRAWKAETATLAPAAAALRVAALLENPVAPTDSIQIHHALLSIPRVGQHKAMPMLIKAGVYSERPIKRLSERQRSILVCLLRELADRWSAR